MSNYSINLCTAVLPRFSFSEMISITKMAGYSGIELRVHEQGHKTPAELVSQGALVKKRLEREGLRVPVLNSYVGIDNAGRVDELLACCETMGVPKLRLVLPRSCSAHVSSKANIKELLPSYESKQNPKFLMNSLRHTLRDIEQKALKRGVKVLVELHWGTVMSSFTSAHYLLSDIDPDAIAVTFDPANMMVEGKEDWEFGISLNKGRIDNVHVKNMSWYFENGSWKWAWQSMSEGMVDWQELCGLLVAKGYGGDYAIEDFLVPQSSVEDAAHYLYEVRKDFESLLSMAELDHNLGKVLGKGLPQIRAA